MVDKTIKICKVSDMESKKAVYVGKNNERFSYGQTGTVLYDTDTGYAFGADGSSEVRAVSKDDLLFTGDYRPAMINPHK